MSRANQIKRDMERMFFPRKQGELQSVSGSKISVVINGGVYFHGMRSGPASQPGDWRSDALWFIDNASAAVVVRIRLRDYLKEVGARSIDDLTDMELARCVKIIKRVQRRLAREV